MWVKDTFSERDENKAFYWINKAAEQNDTVAVHSLGYCYEYGHGVEANPQKAFECYVRAYTLGYGFSAYNISLCYYFGTGVEQSYEKSFEWCKKAVDKGVKKAYASLAYAYHKGEGTVKNLPLAIQYYQKGLETNEDEKGGVLFDMALAYAELSQYGKMIACYQQSADLGYPGSMYNLALCYANGNGVAINMEKCKMLMRKCANQNDDVEVKKLAQETLKSMP